MIILNDLHLGVNRQAGTTPASQSALREFQHCWLREFISTKSGRLGINGDLFDGFSVDVSDVIKAFNTFADWLQGGEGNELWLSAGNHDHSPKADKVSSFQLLSHFLKAQFPDQVYIVTADRGLAYVDGDTAKVWVIPHMPNQTLLDIELQRAVDTQCGKFLLLHANVMNPFAEHSDHSLNISEAQIDALIDAGWTLVVAHEHQPRLLKCGRVIVTGNQVPTSVADCLGNQNDTKYYVKISGDTCHIEPVLTVSSVFQEVDWRSLDDEITAQFIRVTGDCTAAEAAEMVSAVSKLRQKSSAFVVTNAVKIEGIAEMEGLAEMTFENINKFDVLAALCEELTEREVAVVKGLIE